MLNLPISTQITTTCYHTQQDTRNTTSSIMKLTSYSTYALLVTFSPGASSFVPNAARPPARSSSVRTVSYNDVVPAFSAARLSSELNLFGSRWRKTREINSQSKVGKAPITESEVRGLFELWNSALATGDSRIVASRYTKVRFIF
jgi:hypothetical protein